MVRAASRALIVSCLVSLVLAAPLAGRDAPAPASRIEVRVDPRVERMSIVFRLAGNPEYNQPASRSPYADEVEAHFGGFRDHAVVQTARRLRARHGVSYDAVMSMAVHVTDTVTLAERIPFDERPPRLDRRWTVDGAREFLAQARDFVERTEFNRFVADHDAFYGEAAARLRREVEAGAYVDWFDGFFGARPGARFVAIAGLLNGGGSYGVGIRFPDGREEITPVIGVWRFDAGGRPDYGGEAGGTIVHELCHSYTNPIVDRFADELAPAGRRLFPRRAEIMRRQAYGDWKAMMYESLVRACTVRQILAAEGQAAAQARIEYEHGRGFDWVGALSERLGEYETQRDRYPGLAEFMPRVVAFFDTYVEELAALEARAPRVVSMTPANGAEDVDPGATAITITFDRAMRDRSWSVVGGGPEFPETTGPPSYDASRRVFTLPVRLESGRTYRFGLNAVRFSGFRSADGVPLVPVAVHFTTR